MARVNAYMFPFSQSLSRRELTVRLVAALAMAAVLVAAPTNVVAQQDDGFSDVAEGVHKPAIDALSELGLFEGALCAEGKFCPLDPIKRSTMAVWLIRALGEQPAASGATRFADVDVDDWRAPFIERLAELEITVGCRTEPLRYCPDRAVNRGQMATFLVRALDLPEAPSAGFADTSGVHAHSINRLAAANITVGCRQDPLRYCPTKSVTRAQMATFLARALGLVQALQPDTTPTATYKSVTAASGHSCAVTFGDTITCWGRNPYGQADAPAGTYKAVAAGEWYGCAIAIDDTITCWGSNVFGQTEAPQGTYKTIASGSVHSCAIATDDTITCWGTNEFGEADPPAGKYESVTAGSGHSCAITLGDTIVCWGDNRWGQADAPAGTYKSVTAGSFHSCAIAFGDTIACWGDFGATEAPQGTYKTIASGPAHSCAIATDDTITCWGEGYAGESLFRLGAPQGTYKAIAVGLWHGCAIATDDTITCWGKNDNGQTDAPGGVHRALQRP